MHGHRVANDLHGQQHGRARPHDLVLDTVGRCRLRLPRPDPQHDPTRRKRDVQRELRPSGSRIANGEIHRPFQRHEPERHRLGDRPRPAVERRPPDGFVREPARENALADADALPGELRRRSGDRDVGCPARRERPRLRGLGTGRPVHDRRPARPGRDRRVPAIGNRTSVGRSRVRQQCVRLTESARRPGRHGCGSEHRGRSEPHRHGGVAGRRPEPGNGGDRDQRGGRAAQGDGRSDHRDRRRRFRSVGIAGHAGHDPAARFDRLRRLDDAVGRRGANGESQRAVRRP